MVQYSTELLQHSGELHPRQSNMCLNLIQETTNSRTMATQSTLFSRQHLLP